MTVKNLLEVDYVVDFDCNLDLDRQCLMEEYCPCQRGYMLAGYAYTEASKWAKRKDSCPQCGFGRVVAGYCDNCDYIDELIEK